MLSGKFSDGREVRDSLRELYMESFSFREIYYFLGVINQSIMLCGSLLAGFTWLVKYIIEKKK